MLVTFQLTSPLLNDILVCARMVQTETLCFQRKLSAWPNVYALTLASLLSEMRRVANHEQPRENAVLRVEMEADVLILEQDVSLDFLEG